MFYQSPLLTKHSLHVSPHSPPSAVSVMFREKIVTFGGNLRASHIKFGATHDEEEEEFESLSNENCPEVKSDNNKFSSDFSDMKLIEFPKILQEKNLKYLYLPRNNLTKLPSNLLIDLPHLQWLDVRNNALRELPGLKSHKRSAKSFIGKTRSFTVLYMESFLESRQFLPAVT